MPCAECDNRTGAHNGRRQEEQGPLSCFSTAKPRRPLSSLVCRNSESAADRDVPTEEVSGESVVAQARLEKNYVC